jgi:uncharacterized protein YuzE
MTFEYDDLADVMHIQFAEPKSKCTYMISASGAVLRVEEKTGRIVGARVLGWQRTIEKGPLTIPEIEDRNFSAQWIEDHRK